MVWVSEESGPGFGLSPRVASTLAAAYLVAAIAAFILLFSTGWRYIAFLAVFAFPIVIPPAHVSRAMLVPTKFLRTASIAVLLIEVVFLLARAGTGAGLAGRGLSFDPDGYLTGIVFATLIGLLLWSCWQMVFVPSRRSSSPWLRPVVRLLAGSWCLALVLGFPFIGTSAGGSLSGFAEAVAFWSTNLALVLLPGFCVWLLYAKATAADGFGRFVGWPDARKLGHYTALQKGSALAAGVLVSTGLPVLVALAVGPTRGAVAGQWAVPASLLVASFAINRMLPTGPKRATWIAATLVGSALALVATSAFLVSLAAGDLRDRSTMDYAAFATTQALEAYLNLNVWPALGSMAAAVFAVQRVRRFAPRTPVTNSDHAPRPAAASVGVR